MRLTKEAGRLEMFNCGAEGAPDGSEEGLGVGAGTAVNDVVASFKEGGGGGCCCPPAACPPVECHTKSGKSGGWVISCKVMP